MSILIVDDSQDTRLLLETILKCEGYMDVSLAKSAVEAFHLLKMDDVSATNAQVDLILMDILMPEMDGIEACRAIKKDDRLQDVPIIMVTAITEVQDLQSAFAAGAIDYIIKPFNKVELLARVRSALKLKYEMDRRKAREKELLELSRQLEASNKMLERLSYVDGLTGIANRRYFDKFFEQEWKRAMRNASPLSLILMDIDHFKAFNDTYGHQAGDYCLKQVAKALSNAVKRPGDIIARYGGEEFVAVLSETDMSGAANLAELMRTAVIALGIAHTSSDVFNTVTISLGVASAVPTQNVLPALLIEKADKALYKAKKEGRNRVSVSS